MGDWEFDVEVYGGWGCEEFLGGFLGVLEDFWGGRVVLLFVDVGD